MQIEPAANVEFAQEIEQRLIALTNEYRIRHGRTSLAANDLLSAAARKQARRCKDAGRLDHHLGGGLGSRVKAEGYRFAVVRENLAKRFPPAENILEGWIGSAGHRANLLEPRHTQTGVGVIMAGPLAFACAIYAKPLRPGLEGDESAIENSSLVLDQDPDPTPERDSATS